MLPNSTDLPALLHDRVLYEDNHLLILNKMAGEIVQGDQTGDKIRKWAKDRDAV